MDVEERAKLKGQLLEAEQAYHRLMMGKTVREFVDQNGEKVAYMTANVSRLEAYIRGLKWRLGVTAGRNSPIGYIF